MRNTTRMTRTGTRIVSAYAAVVAIAVGTTACGRQAADPVPVKQEPKPIALAVADRMNAAPSLAALGKTVAAVWTASTDKQSDIYLSVSFDSGATFGQPVRVNDVEGDARASGEQAARVAVGAGNIIHVAWPSRQGDVTVIRYAESVDRGQSFSKARTVAGASTLGARGWHALTLGYDGAPHVVWLDGRNADRSGAAGAKPHAHKHGSATAKDASAKKKMSAGAPRQDIFHASWGRDGVVSERMVASNVCFCCKTAVATSGDKVYAAWRHIYPGGIRDIAVARSSDNGATFQAPVRASEDGWKIDACPDDGPSMIADSHGRIYLAWPTLVPGDTPRKGIFYAALGDAGTFSPRLRLDSGTGDAAHPQIGADLHGVTAVVWDERAEGSRRIVLRRVSETGVPAEPQMFNAEGASYPVVVAADGHWVVLWSQEGPDGRQVIAGRQIAFDVTH